MNDETDLAKRMGFSAEVLKDCGPGSPPTYQRWLREARRTPVPPGEFWFFVNQIEPGTGQSIADAIKQQIEARGEHLKVRVKSRL
jgi:hypothetical protein